MLTPRSSLLPYAAALVLVLGLASCGGSTGPSRTSVDVPNVSRASSGIAAFGEAAGPHQYRAIVGVLHDYSKALADDDGPAACRLLSASIRSQVRGLAGGSDGIGSAGCGPQLSSMYAAAGQSRRSLRVTAVRIGAGEAYAVYRGQGATSEFFPLVQEAGAWKVAALGGSKLP